MWAVCPSSGLRPNGPLKDGGVQRDRSPESDFQAAKRGCVKPNHFRTERSLKGRRDMMQGRDACPALQTTAHHHYLSSFFPFFNFRETANFPASGRR